MPSLEPFRSPGETALIFLKVLDMDLTVVQHALLKLTTPESHATWGDFSGASAALANLARWGMVSLGDSSTPGVQYIAVFESRQDADQSDVVDAETGMLVGARLIISLVDRPALGGWLVHAMGNIRVHPDDLPLDG